MFFPIPQSKLRFSNSSQTRQHDGRRFREFFGELFEHGPSRKKIPGNRSGGIHRVGNCVSVQILYDSWEDPFEKRSNNAKNTAKSNYNGSNDSRKSFGFMEILYNTTPIHRPSLPLSQRQANSKRFHPVVQTVYTSILRSRNLGTRSQLFELLNNWVMSPHSLRFPLPSPPHPSPPTSLPPLLPSSSLPLFLSSSPLPPPMPPEAASAGQTRHLGLAKRFCAVSGRACDLRPANRVKSPGANGAKALRQPRPAPLCRSSPPFLSAAPPHRFSLPLLPAVPNAAGGGSGGGSGAHWGKTGEMAANSR